MCGSSPLGRWMVSSHGRDFALRIAYAAVVNSGADPTAIHARGYAGWSIEELLRRGGATSTTCSMSPPDSNRTKFYGLGTRLRSVLVLASGALDRVGTASRGRFAKESRPESAASSRFVSWRSPFQQSVVYLQRSRL